jgi:hypothetical protein
MKHPARRRRRAAHEAPFHPPVACPCFLHAAGGVQVFVFATGDSNLDISLQSLNVEANLDIGTFAAELSVGCAAGTMGCGLQPGHHLTDAWGMAGSGLACSASPVIGMKCVGLSRREWTCPRASLVNTYRYCALYGCPIGMTMRPFSAS